MAGIDAVKRIDIHRIDRALPVFNSTTTQIFTRIVTARENWFWNVTRRENSAMARDGKKNKFTFLEKNTLLYALVVASSEIILHYNYLPGERDRKKKRILLPNHIIYCYEKYNSMKSTIVWIRYFNYQHVNEV